MFIVHITIKDLLHTRNISKVKDFKGQIKMKTKIKNKFKIKINYISLNVRINSRSKR